MIRTRACALGLLVALTFAGPALARMPACGNSIARHDQETPLTCRNFSSDGREVRWLELAEKLGTAQYVLLGEVHDNPDHHRLRAALITELAGAGKTSFKAGPPFKPRSPALVFEHIGADKQAALDKYSLMIEAAREGEDIETAVAELLVWLEWENSGWPAGSLFKPLFVAARSGRLAIYPGDPQRGKVRAVARAGMPALADTERARLGLDAPLPASQQAALLDELEASHCGLMPKSAFGNMAVSQRYRDAHLAAAVVAAAATHGRAVLLAGNGHVRSDRGVPYYLRQMAPDRKIAAVLFLEVQDGKTDPAAYVERGPGGQPIADYIVLTPRADRPDPCEAMRRQFAPKSK